MNLKTQLKIVIGFIIVASVIFSILIFTSVQNYRKAFHNTTVATQIVFEVFQRRLLGDEYLFNGVDRSREQWFIKQERIKKIISENEKNFSTPEEVDAILKIKSGLSGSEATFQQIILLNEENLSSSSASLQERRTRLSSQLSVKAQETVSAAVKLDEINKKNVRMLLDQIILLFSIVASLFFIMLFMSFGIVFRGADLLERKKAEGDAILKGIGDSVFAINTSSKIILFNKAASEISGYSIGEAMGKSYKEILKFTLEGKSEIKDDFIKKALHGERAEMSNNTVVTRKDGKIVPVADSAAPIFDAKGNVQGVVVVFRDVTHERELTKMKDEFVSIASHELRTPMTAIKGLISMIRDGDYGPVNKELSEPMDDIYASTERLIHLVNDLLNVSRIEAGRVKFSLSDISMNDLIEEVISTLAPIAKQKNINLSSHHLSEEKVSADSDKVKQIINNLVGNSLKFTDHGSITISSEIKDKFYRVTITDTGIGISEDDQHKLFGKFQQSSTVEKGRPQGTGLGLYISRELARKMGGDLWIEKSELKKGSTFIFTIPLSDSEKAEEVKKDLTAETKAHPDQK